LSFLQDVLGWKRPLLAFQKSQTQSLAFQLNIGQGAFDAVEQCYLQTAKDLRGAKSLGELSVKFSSENHDITAWARRVEIAILHSF